MRAARAGATLKDIASYAGISRDTLDRWRREREEFSDKLDRIRSAEVVRILEEMRDGRLGNGWRQRQRWLSLVSTDYRGDTVPDRSGIRRRALALIDELQGSFDFEAGSGSG